MKLIASLAIVLLLATVEAKFGFFTCPSTDSAAGFGISTIQDSELYEIYGPKVPFYKTWQCIHLAFPNVVDDPNTTNLLGSFVTKSGKVKNFKYGLFECGSATGFEATCTLNIKFNTFMKGPSI